jgi:hypothetical protein
MYVTLTLSFLFQTLCLFVDGTPRSKHRVFKMLPLVDGMSSWFIHILSSFYTFPFMRVFFCTWVPSDWGTFPLTGIDFFYF